MSLTCRNGLASAKVPESLLLGMARIHFQCLEIHLKKGRWREVVKNIDEENSSWEIMFLILMTVLID